MRRVAPVAVFVAVVLAGLAAVLASAATDERVLAFTLGVVPQRATGPAEEGKELCQAPIDVTASFDALRFRISATGESGPPVDVRVRSVAGGRVLGSGRLPAGFKDESDPLVRVRPAVAEGSRVAVCLQSVDPDTTIEAWGDLAQATRASALSIGGERTDKDMTLVFYRPRPASALSLLPTMVERAALFRPSWLGAPVLVVLGVLVLVAVPASIALALLRVAPGGTARRGVGRSEGAIGGRGSEPR